VHPKDAAVLQKVAAQWRKGGNVVDVHKHLATWDVKRPCSQWYGVTCDSATRRVTSLKLPKEPRDYYYQGLGPDLTIFSLSGPIPAELASLPELRSLNLVQQDSLDPKSGLFQAVSGRLRKLSHLDLSDVPFGDIWTGYPVFVPRPAAICNLTSLTYLNLHKNGFSGLPLEFTRLSRLSWVDLSFSNFTDKDIQILGSLTSLKSLILSNQFLDSGFKGLSRLRGLKQLDLSYTQLEQLPHISERLTTPGFPQPEIVRVDPGLEYSVPSWLGLLQQLTSLDLSSNSFSGSLPSQLGLLTRLVRLDLSMSELRGTIPQGLLNFPSLIDLRLPQ